MKNQISTSFLASPKCFANARKLFNAVLFSSFLFTQAKAQIGCVANWNSNTTASAPCTVFFTNTSTGGTNTAWNWTFGDGETSTLQNPVHTYSVSGTYNVCLKIFCGNYSDTACKTVTVQCGSIGSCAADWTSQSGTNSCTVYFTDASTGTNPITSWSWTFGDGQTSTLQNPVHPYSVSGSYTVCLTITAATPNGNCTNTLCKTVTVQCGGTVSCAANWVGQSGTGSCTFYFSNTSTGTNASTTYNWTFGDGQTSTLQNSPHTYSASGTYTVCLTITVPNPADPSRPCINTLCKTVEVYCATGIASSSQIDLSLSVTNPVFYSADIQYSIPSSGSMELVLFDIVGNKISMLESGNKSTGMHSYTLSTGAFSKGIYFIHFSFEGAAITKKIVIAE